MFVGSRRARCPRVKHGGGSVDRFDKTMPSNAHKRIGQLGTRLHPFMLRALICHPQTSPARKKTKPFKFVHKACYSNGTGSRLQEAIHDQGPHDAKAIEDAPASRCGCDLGHGYTGDMSSIHGSRYGMRAEAWAKTVAKCLDQLLAQGFRLGDHLQRWGERGGLGLDTSF